MQYLYIYIYIYVEFVSSPYLFVFGDDHVRGTWEYMILQVDLVRPRNVAGLVLGEDFFIRVFIMFWNSCNILYY